MAEINEKIPPREIRGDKDEYDPTKKREVIKTLLIIFLAVMLVLTFFSNTIMNKSLAEITTERAISGKLTERIRGSGMVESNQTYGVSVDGNKVIDKIMVKNGQEVKKDDVLFTVGTGESPELTAAEEALTTLKLNYQKAMLSLPADYSSEDQEIKNAKKDLENAIKRRDKAINEQENVNNSKNEYDSNRTKLSDATKLRTKFSSMITAVDTDDYSEAPAEYTGELIPLLSAYNDAKSAYDKAFELYSSLVKSEDSDAPAASQKDIDTAKAESDAKEKSMNEARESYNNAKSQRRGEFVSRLSETDDEIERLERLIEEYKPNNSGGGMTIEELNAEISAKERILENAIIALEKTKKNDDNKKKLEDLDLESMRNEVDKAQKKVDKLRKENETTEVRSKYDGIVSAINLRAGETTTPGSDVVTLDLSEDGYTVKITVDGEKSRMVKKGTSAEVVNNWSGGIDAVLTDIKNDTQAGSKNRILVFSVTGDVHSGSFIDLSIPCGSGNYDTIVPKSAVNEDSNGKFVLVVKQKNSPLGNRYFAERVSVDVTASDESSSAVSGMLTPSDYVIVAASKPVAAKDQVRMKDK